MKKNLIFIFLLLFPTASNAAFDIELKGLREKFLKIIEQDIENYLYFVLTIETNGADLNLIEEKDKKYFKEGAKKVAHSSFTNCIEKDSYNYSTNPVKLFYREVVDKGEFPLFIPGREEEFFDIPKDSWFKTYSIKIPEVTDPMMSFILSDTDSSEIEAIEYNGIMISGKPAKSLYELLDLTSKVKKCTFSQMKVLKQ